jgi:hypothetical protein
VIPLVVELRLDKLFELQCCSVQHRLVGTNTIRLVAQQHSLNQPGLKLNTCGRGEMPRSESALAGLRLHRFLSSGMLRRVRTEPDVHQVAAGRDNPDPKAAAKSRDSNLPAGRAQGGKDGNLVFGTTDDTFGPIKINLFCYAILFQHLEEYVWIVVFPD